MIPQGLQRRLPSRPTKLPLWALIALGVGAVVVLFLLWVLLTMGSAPAVTDVMQEVTL